MNMGIYLFQGFLIVVITALLASAADSHFTVLTKPEALIFSNGSVVEGSVIQIYCTVENDATVTFTWTHNGNPLLNDPPHIRIREHNCPQHSVSLLTDDSTTVLTVDNFRASDNGTYQCTATSGANGTAITLTAVSSTANGALNLADQPALNEPVDLTAILNDNRTGIALGDTVNGSLLRCTVGHQGDELMNYSAPSVVWVRNGQVVDGTDPRITITTSTPTANGQVTSSLTIADFGLSDAGVYQCVVTDDNDGGEVITSIPHQLSTLATGSECVSVQAYEFSDTAVGGLLSAGIILMFMFIVAVIAIYFWINQLKMVYNNKKRRRTRKKAELSLDLVRDPLATRKGEYEKSREEASAAFMLDSEYDPILD